MSQTLLTRLASVAGSKVAVTILTILTTPIIVQLLGSSHYGDYAAIMSFISLLMIFIDFGSFTSMRKYISQNNRSAEWISSIFVFFVFFLSIVLSLLVSLLYILSLFNISESFVNKYLIFIIPIILFRQVFSVFRASLMGLGKERVSEPLKVIVKIVFSVVSVVLIYYGWGVVGVLSGHIFSALVGFMIAGAYLRRYINNISIGRAMSIIPASDIVSFSFFNMVLVFLVQSLRHFDILYLSFFASSSSIGYYKAALVIAEFLWFVPQVLQSVFVQSSSELWAREKVNRIESLSAKATRYTLAVTVLLSIGIAALSEPFFTLYFGNQFDQSISIFLILTPGVIGFALARQIYAVSQGKGSIRLLIIATSLPAVLNVVLNTALIPVYGVTGAAVATSAGYGIMFPVHVMVARKIGFRPASDLRPWRILIAAVITYPVLQFCNRMIESDILSLIVIPIIGLVVYSVISVRLGVVDHDELRRLRAEIGNLI